MEIASFLRDSEDIKSWFKQSGVKTPLRTCMGPLPISKASIVRWTADGPCDGIQELSPHPGSYRISVILEPLEARIWLQDHLIWGGTIAANRFRICLPNTTSRWSQLSACDIVNIFIPIDFIDQITETSGINLARELNGNLFTSDKTVLDLVQKMIDAEQLAGPFAMQFCDALMMALVTYLLEYYTQRISRDADSALSGTRLRRILEFMHARIADEVSIAELAARCGMSESHFSREFRRAIGLPPHQYLIKKRLELASQALLDPDRLIVDIALEFGFQHASHFSRSFNAHFGMAPAHFRRRKRIE